MAITKEDRERVEIIEKILRLHFEELDLLASYQHYLVWDEIKLIRKPNLYV